MERSRRGRIAAAAGWIGQKQLQGVLAAMIHERKLCSSGVRIVRVSLAKFRHITIFT
jgi:hypothetical protein